MSEEVKLTNLADIDINSPEHKMAIRKNEYPYRRGFMQGFAYAMDFMALNMSDERMRDYLNGPLFTWRFCTTPESMVPPPPIRTPSKTEG